MKMLRIKYIRIFRIKMLRIKDKVNEGTYVVLNPLKVRDNNNTGIATNIQSGVAHMRSGAYIGTSG